MQRPEKLSSAEISSICQAAGLQAVRRNRYIILPADFEDAWKQVVKKGDDLLELCVDLGFSRSGSQLTQLHFCKTTATSNLDVSRFSVPLSHIAFPLRYLFERSAKLQRVCAAILQPSRDVSYCQYRPFCNAASDRHTEESRPLLNSLGIRLPFQCFSLP